MEPRSKEEMGRTVLSSWARATVAEFRDGSTALLSRIPWAPGTVDQAYMALYRACQSPANRNINVTRANGCLYLCRAVKESEGADES